MPVSAYWLNDEQTIVQYDFEGRWTWDEFYPEYQKALKMERSVTHRVDVLMDFRRSKSVPPSALTHMRKITDNQPDNIGLSVFVTTNPFFNVMYTAGVRFYPKMQDYFVIVETIEEAYEIIQAARKQVS
jgi:hypothetical protein